MPVDVSSETIQWLLSVENPPVRYLTLTRLLNRSARSRDVREAKRRLGSYAPVRRILKERRRFWKKGARLYQKYGGGHWQIIFLGEFLAPRETPGVEEGVEFLLDNRKPLLQGAEWWGIHCLNANILRAMVALGFGDDPRVRAGLDHVARDVVRAEGITCPVIDWSLLPLCHMALPKVLLAMTALPPQERSPAMRRAARICVARLLERDVSRYVSPHARKWHEHVRRTDSIPSSISVGPYKRLRVEEAKREFLEALGGLGPLEEKAGWRRFGFPLHYNSDILEALRSLAAAGAPRRSAGTRHAIEHILDRRLPDGRWKLDFSLNGKMIADVEVKGKPSRWITFHALSVLRYFRGLRLPT